MADITAMVPQAKQQMTDVVEAFKVELNKLRIGAVNVEAVKNVNVEVYGSNMPMYQIATISSPSATTLVITPWDKGNLKGIASALEAEFKNDINPNIKDNAVFINFPALTQEKREEFVKLLKEKSEHFRQSLRNVRQDIKSDIEKIKKDGDAPEDIIFKTLEDLDEATKTFTEQINELYENKKNQLLK